MGSSKLLNGQLNGSHCAKSEPPPAYASLPEKIPGFRCSWDYFNSLQSASEVRDELGTLNFLRPERVRAARKEIQTGQSISLDLEFSALAGDISAFGGRQAPRHTISGTLPFANEDEVEFNTQTGSQWDGLRHFAIRRTNIFYNGCTNEDFQNSDILGTHRWCERGGITGRGVLVDWFRWAAAQAGDPPDPNDGYGITLADIQEVLAAQGTIVKPGDILIVRTGWVRWYKASPSAHTHDLLCLAHQPGTHRFVGVEASQDFVAWLWNNQIAAVGSDTVAFEATPPPEGGFGWLHEHLLAGLGCPMGEIWDLEKLSEACEERTCWSFFFASAPLHIRGGVASPSNALAVL